MQVQTVTETVMPIRLLTVIVGGGFIAVVRPYPRKMTQGLVFCLSAGSIFGILSLQMQLSFPFRSFEYNSACIFCVPIQTTS
jgi:hypothetical protein